MDEDSSDSVIIFCSDEDEDNESVDDVGDGTVFRISLKELQKYSNFEWKAFIKNLAVKCGDMQQWAESDFKNSAKFLFAILDFLEKNPIDSGEIWKSLLGIAKAVCTNTKLWSYEFQKRLLRIVFKSNPTNEKQINYFAQMMYALSWNFMGENHNTLTPKHSMELILVSFQWFFALPNPNLEKAGNKLARFIGVVSPEKNSGEEAVNLIRFFLDSILKILEPIVSNVTGNEAEKEATGFNQLITSICKISKAYSIVEYHEKCLRLMCRWIGKKKSFRLVGPYDILQPEPEIWAATWNKVKKEASDPNLEIVSLYEIIKHNGAKHSHNFLRKVALFELNTYFTSRHVFPNAIITIGELLEDHGQSEALCSLGLITQAIGFWWGGEIDDPHPVNLCKEALELLNTGAKKESDDPLPLIVASIAKIWLGICYLRLLQISSQKELDSIRELVKDSNPKKYKSVQNMKGRSVPTISSLNLKDENEVANLLICGVDYLYILIQFGASMKSWVDSVSPALLIITVRLAAAHLTLYGDTYSCIRAWYVLWILCKTYSTKYIQMQAGIELVRLVPNLDQNFILELEDLEVENDKNVPKAHFLNIQIAKSSAAFQRGDYLPGLEYLVEVLVALRNNSCSLDMSYLVLSEAYALLAQYKAVLPSRELNTKAYSISPYLLSMSPSSLALKGLRTIHSISRVPNENRSSAWQDLAFNNNILLSYVRIATRTFDFMKTYGKLKDLKYYTAEVLFFYQQMGLVSRSSSILLLLAEMDLSGHNFDSAQRKLDAVYKLFNVDIQSGAIMTEMTEEDVKDFAKKKLRLEASTIELIRNPPRTSWSISPLDLPEHYYKGPKPENLMGFKQDYSLPKFLQHSLNCSCYVCLHPFIIQIFIKFLNLQARFAAYQSKSTNEKGLELTIIGLGQSYLIRSMFRILIHFERMGYRLSHAFAEEMIGDDALERCYKDLFVRTEIHTLITIMEITPSKEYTTIWSKVKHLSKLYEQLDDEEAFKQFIPLEIGAAAVFNASENGVMTNCNIRSLLLEAMKMSTEVTESIDAITPPMSKEDEKVRPPPSPPKKRMARKAKN